MTAITYVSNWKLKIQRKECSITILHAVTCDNSATLPETIFGLPVTSLGPHALSTSADTSGEEVLLVHGTPLENLVWNNLYLQELYLPSTLETVGDCAFLGCWNLRSLHLWDNIRFWGGCVLSSCRSLHNIDIRCNYEKLGVSASYLVEELSQELDMTLRKPSQIIRLMFPAYLEADEEAFVAQAVQFSYQVYGAGLPYHQYCFVKDQLNLREYDTLWKELLRTEHDEGCAVRLAWWRLRYPAELTERAREAYLAHLKGHVREAAAWLLEQRDLTGLHDLLGWTAPDRETLSAVCALARDRQAPEAVAMLLEEQHRRFPPAAERSFDL